MAILDFKIENIGQSGEQPSFVYLQTDNTVAEVTTAGFLNNFVAQGNQLSEYNMALVSTRTSPNSKTNSLGLYTIAFSSSVYSLSAFGAGGITGATNLGTGLNVFASVSGSNLQFNTILGTINGGVIAALASNTISLSVDQSSDFTPTWLGSHTFNGSTFQVTAVEATVSSTESTTIASGTTVIIESDVISMNNGSGSMPAATTVAWAAPTNKANPATYSMLVYNNTTNQIEIASLA
jgi:hypothetical protein